MIRLGPLLFFLLLPAAELAAQMSPLKDLTLREDVLMRPAFAAAIGMQEAEARRYVLDKLADHGVPISNEAPQTVLWLNIKSETYDQGLSLVTIRVFLLGNVIRSDFLGSVLFDENKNIVEQLPARSVASLLRERNSRAALWQGERHELLGPQQSGPTKSNSEHLDDLLADLGRVYREANKEE